MYDFRFYLLSKGISIRTGRWEGVNEKVYAMGPRLRLERFPPPVGLEPGTANPASNVQNE